MGKDRELKEAKRRAKDSETPEEKRQRRLEKKRAKYGNDWQPEKKDVDTFGYDNNDNRFGDANLGEQFTWHKKIDEMVKKGEDPRELTDPKLQKRRKQDLKEEITKLKVRRDEREQEKVMMEEERDNLQREREMLQWADWEKKEDEFHLDQAKHRTAIRIKTNRARPIDVLSKNLLLDDTFDMEMTEPYKIFRGLPMNEIEELKEDLRSNLELATSGASDNRDYWASLMVVCDDELEKHRSMVDADAALASDHGINHAVSDDINTMFTGKNSNELGDLDIQIKGHIENGHAADVEYWENLLKRLQIHKAKAKLREIHQQLLQQRLRKLTNRDDGVMDEDGGANKYHKGQIRGEGGKAEDEDTKAMPPPSAVGAQDEEEEEDGGWSPAYFSDLDEDDKEFVVDEEEDLEELEVLRKQVAKTEQTNLDLSLVQEGAQGSEEEALFAKEKARADEDADGAEVNFNDAVDLSSEQYWWHDKYRPRKPRYFNRVHTGYEWNKYNQTHYDHDNPPPKVVQGYKFNVFYPDLIDKTKAPAYHVNPDPDGNPELCVIRFSAGPPYEDIAFKVVNREWEYSHKKGYKCTFDRGILHLFFNFKRHRYRR